MVYGMGSQSKCQKHSETNLANYRAPLTVCQIWLVSLISLGADPNMDGVPVGVVADLPKRLSQDRSWWSVWLYTHHS